MSPENDQKPAVAAETITADSQSDGVAVSELPGTTGAAAAVARAPEVIATIGSPEQETPSAMTDIGPAVTSSETEPIATNEPAAAATQIESSEPAESTETMDQLLDQFSAPESIVAEGEIFDGRVLAVTEAGVVVDVGGKFEGLVPA